MSCHFHFLVARHPADAIKVLMHATPAGQREDELLLVASPEPQCALSLGLPALPSGGGLAGLLQEDVGGLVVPLRETGTRFYAVFPSAAEAGRRSYSELLDLARFQLSSPVPVKVVVEYARLRADLPPMYAEDELTCFWEVRDLLADEDSAAFAFLAERVENELPRFHGLRLYTRHQGPPGGLDERALSIAGLSGLCADGGLLAQI